MMEIKQLNPVEVKRDKSGSWIHPEYFAYLDALSSDADYLTNDEWAELKQHFGIKETKTVWLEDFVSLEIWEKMNDDCDISGWNPIAPDGFFLIDIGFGEEDGYAIFARTKHESKVA